MPNTKEAKGLDGTGIAEVDVADKAVPKHVLTPEIQESLIEQAKVASGKHLGIEAVRADEEIKARHEFLGSLEPTERDRLFEQLKARHGSIPTFPTAAFPLVPRTFYYQVMRPPFAPVWAIPSPRHVLHCYDVSKSQTSSLLHESSECIPDQGAFSLHVCLGRFNNVECRQALPWVIGEAIHAKAHMAFDRQMSMGISWETKLVVEVDYVVENPGPWACLMIPGVPASGLGLVGALGIANMSVTAMLTHAPVNQGTWDRFLMGSASAHFPGDLDLKQAFTLSTSVTIPGGEYLNWYHIYMDAELTAFRSVPSTTSFPGSVQANLTVPNTSGVIGSSAPLKVTEIRVTMYQI